MSEMGKFSPEEGMTMLNEAPLTNSDLPVLRGMVDKESCTEAQRIGSDLEAAILRMMSNLRPDSRKVVAEKLKDLVDQLEQVADRTRAGRPDNTRQSDYLDSATEYKVLGGIVNAAIAIRDFDKPKQ